MSIHMLIHEKLTHISMKTLAWRCHSVLQLIPTQLRTFVRG